MKIIFEVTTQPNFIKSNVGYIALKDLSEEDINEYCDLWVSEFKAKHKKRCRKSRKS